MKCPVFDVPDVETSSSLEFSRKKKKNGEFYKEDIAKERKLNLISFGLHCDSPEIFELNFSLYKSLDDVDAL